MVNGEPTLEVVLTPREMEVLRLIASGTSNRDIAQQLCISTGTLGRHMTNLYAKTGLARQKDERATRGQLVAIAFASGLGPESIPSIRVVEGRRNKCG
jgi:ATP/maltotriose-dependent transcriptional regulator MalT